MPVQSATITSNLPEDKPTPAFQFFDLPQDDSGARTAEPEEAPLTLGSGPDFPTIFAVYPFI
jgi:hypothetical protein